MVTVFASDPGDRGSIPGWAIPKVVLDAFLLNTQHYKVRIKGKWSNQGKGVEPPPTLRFYKYWKESLTWLASANFRCIYLYTLISILLDISMMGPETWVQSQIELYQRLKKWYFMPPCLTLNIIRYGSRVKSRNPGKRVAPSPTPWCSSYRKRSLWVILNYGRQLYLFISILSLSISTYQSILISSD